MKNLALNLMMAVLALTGSLSLAEESRVCRAIPVGPLTDDPFCIEAHDNLYVLPNELWNKTVCADVSEFTFGKYTYEREPSTFGLQVFFDDTACEWEVRANRSE